jgi:hypothetical protein
LQACQAPQKTRGVEAERTGATVFNGIDEIGDRVGLRGACSVSVRGTCRPSRLVVGQCALVIDDTLSDLPVIHGDCGVTGAASE